MKCLFLFLLKLNIYLFIFLYNLYVKKLFFFFLVKKTVISLLMLGYQGQFLYVNVNEELKLQYFSAFGMNFRNGANYISAYFQNTHIVFSKKLCAKGCRPIGPSVPCKEHSYLLLSPQLGKTALSLVMWGPTLLYGCGSQCLSSSYSMDHSHITS